MTEELHINASFTNGAESSIVLSKEKTLHAHIEFIPESSIDITTLTLAGAAGANQLTIEFVPACVPEYPAYIRWVNNLGGWEYHMFAANKTLSLEVDPNDSYALANGQDITSTRTRSILGVERIDTVEVGATNLSFIEYNRLTNIALSPCFEVYNQNLKVWQGAIIDSKTKNKWDTKNSLGVISFSIRLIDQPTQF